MERVDTLRRLTLVPTGHLTGLVDVVRGIDRRAGRLDRGSAAGVDERHVQGFTRTEIILAAALLALIDMEHEITGVPIETGHDYRIRTRIEVLAVEPGLEG